MTGTTGKGSPEVRLDAPAVEEICRETLASVDLRGKRVLVLIPDHTRHAPIGLFFRVLYALLGKSAQCLDYLVATGTHRAMEEERLYRHVGITPDEHRNAFPNVHFLVHEHDNPAKLRTIGTIPASEIRALTGGLFDQDIPVSINRAVLEYDHVIIVSPVVPHEAMGFAGGNKYFFPGVGGSTLSRRSTGSRR